MTECKSCGKKISDGNLLICPSCGATICSDCGKRTTGICPYCYSNLEYMG